MSMRTPSTFLALTLLACAGDRSATPLAPASALVLPRVEPAAHAEPMRLLPAQPPTELANAWVDFLGNGNLTVVTDSTLHLFDGKRWTERSWPDETGISVERAYDSSQASLVVGNHSGWSARYASIQLISPVDLATLYEGRGRVVDGVLAVPALKANGEAPRQDEPLDDRAVLLEHRGRLVTLQLPRDHGPSEVTALRLQADDDLAVVSWQSDSQAFAEAYVLSTGVRVGSAIAHDPVNPVAILRAHVQYYIALMPAPTASTAMRGSSAPPPPTPTMPPPASAFADASDSPRRALVVRDVRTGVVLQQRVIACKSMLANPTVAPDGSTVLVTCGADAIVLDGRSLAEKRRIKSVIPGCDNGMDLSGRLVNATTLVVEGCGGVARLNVGTGRYVCGDNAGVMGGPYAPMDERKITAPKAPACTAADDTAHQSVGSHGSYTYLLDEKIVRGPGGASVQLESDASMPVLSPNEDRMAYVTGDAIMLRELPSGTALDVRGK